MSTLDWVGVIRLKRIIREHIYWIKREVRLLYRIESDQRKRIGFEQKDQTKKSRADESKKSGEENLSLRKFPEG